MTVAPRTMKPFLTILLMIVFASVARADDKPSKTEQVAQLLKQAQALYNFGIYDQAFRCCEQALEIDPYSIAARQEQEKINLAKVALIQKNREKRREASEGLMFPVYPPQPLGNVPSKAIPK